MQGIRRTLFGLAAAATFVLPQTGRAQNVDLALALLLDVSGSVDNTEFVLQRTGYVNAFNSATVWAAINSGTYGAIAANLVYWSSGQQLALGWTLIDSFAASQAFATAIAGTTRPGTIGTLTGLGDALDFGGNEFANLGTLNATRWVMDVSGDGCQNEGIPTLTGRGNAVADGVDQINGIVIGPFETGDCDPSDPDILGHYTNRVIYGDDAFVNTADTFDDFESAIEAKMVREITGTVPEPATVILMGSGLLGIGAMARRRRQERKED